MHPRTTLAGLAGAALLTASLASVATAPGAVAEAPAAPAATSPVALTGADEIVAYAYRKRVYTDFGLRLVAGDEPFEVRAQRPTYDDPITATWHRESGDVALPEGTMDSFAGLTDFVTMTVTSVKTGDVVKTLSIDSCLNGYSTRTRPDAPGRSPYPMSCPWNPYTVGSVMGIQEGWATPMFGEYGRSFKIEPGRYDVSASIDPAMAALFEIAPEDSSVETRLIVKKQDRFRGRPAAPSVDGGPSSLPAHATEPTRDAAGAPAPETAPDLRSLPAFDIQLNPKGTAIRFAATTWNGGGGPLVVDGFRESGEDHMDAYQYFYGPEGEETGYQQVGQFHFHGANHQHWHFEDFAQYRLLNADETLAVKSTKASWCLANTDAVDYTVPNADWQPENTDLSSACGGPEAQGLREVLSNGSGDTYLQFRAGQAFRIGNVPDGTYFISVEANPNDALIEADYDNNDSLRQITLGTNKRTGERWVKAAQVGVIDETMPRFFR